MLLFRDDMSLLTEITKPVGYDFEGNFNSMYHERNALVVTTLDPVLLLV